MDRSELKARRLLAKVTLKQLAQALQTSERTMAGYEAGDRDLPRWITERDVLEAIERLDWRKRPRDREQE